MGIRFPRFSFGYPRWNPQALFCGGCQPLPKVGKYTCTSGRSVAGWLGWLFFTFLSVGLGLGLLRSTVLLGGEEERRY